MKYHSALKQYSSDEVGECSYLCKNDKYIFTMDINEPNEYKDIYLKADVIYAELPWRSGYDVFMSKVYKDQPFPTYKQFIYNVNDFISELNKPTIIVAGAQVKNMMKKPYNLSKITINFHKSLSNSYTYNIDIPEFEYTVDLIEYLSNKYDCLGNFCCGYGYTGEIFMKNNKNFIMSDVNTNCISSIRNNILISTI